MVTVKTRTSLGLKRSIITREPTMVTELDTTCTTSLDKEALMVSIS